MEQNGSSAKRRTKKADSPIRRTSSLTTVQGETSGNRKIRKKGSETTSLKAEGDASIAGLDFVVQGRESKGENVERKVSGSMGKKAQREFLQLLERGCTAAFACHQMGRSMSSLAKTLEKSRGFREEYEELQMLMNQRVESALYKAALKGNVSAQTLWLRNRPPPGWKSSRLRSKRIPRLEEMTDEEVFRLAKAEGIDLPKEPGEGTGVSSSQ